MTPILGAPFASRRMFLREWLEPLVRIWDANQERLRRDMIGSKIADAAKKTVHVTALFVWLFTQNNEMPKLQ
jgi:hypothetical protein